MIRQFHALLFASALLMLPGCGTGERDVTKEKIEKMTGEPMKETVPVKGTVLIDGQPAPGVNIFAYTAGAVKEAAAQVRTDADGTYCWTTYQPCDGLPPGEYKLAFTHVVDEGKGKKEGADLLKGKYRDPSKSEFSLTVKSGEPQSDANYELKY